MAAKPPRKRARTKVPNDDSQKHGAAAAREPPSGTPGKPVEMRSRLVPQEGDGVLERMCKVMLANLGLDAFSKLCDNIARLGALSVGSMCSGSEVWCLALHTLFQVLGVGKVKSKFACECVRAKAAFIHQVVHETILGDTAVCCFTDIMDMHGHVDGKAACHVHQQRCCIATGQAGPQLVSVGFSCKNLSRLFSSKRPEHQRKDWLAAQAGSTGQTFAGMLSYVDNAEPPLLHFENVPDLLADHSWPYLIEQFRQRGYVVQGMLLQSDKYGCPQSRTRVHGLAVHLRQCRLDMEAAEAFFKHFWAAVAQMEMDPLPLDMFPLPDDDEYITGELTRIQANRPDIVKTDDKEWRRTQDTFLKQQGIRWGQCVAPEAQRASPWFATMPPRERMIVAYAIQTNPDIVAADVSQSIERSASNKTALVRTLHPGGKVWLFKRKRPLMGIEALCMQGFGLKMLRDCVMRVVFTDSLAKDLAGNSYTGSVVMAFLTALILHWPWPDCLPPGSGNDVDAIANVLARLK